MSSGSSQGVQGNSWHVLDLLSRVERGLWGAPESDRTFVCEGDSLKIWGNLCRYTGRDAVWFRTSGLTQTCPEMITALYITGCLGFKVRTAPLYWQTEVVPFGGLPGRRPRVRPEPAGLVRKASEVWNTAQPAGDLTLMDGYVFTSRHFWWALGSERSLFL